MAEVTLATVTGNRSRKGWNVKLALDLTVRSISTREDEALLLEKIACTASGMAANIRQGISAGEDD